MFYILKKDCVPRSKLVVDSTRAISVSNLVEFFKQRRLMLATAMKCHDSCGIRFVLPALFSDITESIPGT
jgi:hypothetical protein